MNLKRTKLVTIALAFVMVASAISGGLVLADNPPDGAAQPGNSRFDQRQHRNAGNGEILTELLGLTTEDIRTQRADGLSLVQIAESVGVSEAELVAALTQGVTERLTQAVIDGKITQEQADTLLDRAVVRTTEMVNNTEPRQPRPRQQRPNQRQFGRSGGNGGGNSGGTPAGLSG